MARKLQDPLANIKALMTDNDINFNSGNDETSYGFQLQPVYAVPFEKQGFNLVNRAVIPILGMADGGQKPILGEPTPSGDGYTWGLSDSLLQFFFSPKTEDPWKWGLGPMVSLKTRTDDKLAGPGWGGGQLRCWSVTSVRAFPLPLSADTCGATKMDSAPACSSQ